MKIRFLIERIKDYPSSVFKTKRGGLKKKKKPLPIALVSALVLALAAFVFFTFFNGGNARTAQPRYAADAQTAASGMPSARAVQEQKGGGLSLEPDGGLSLEIVPGRARVGTALHLSSKGFNLSDARIEWTVNGMMRVPDYSFESNTKGPFELDTKDLVKGDAVQAEAGINGMEIRSNSVTMRGAPLAFESVKLLPEASKTGESLYVDAIEAGGGIKNIVYEWTVNGKFAGNSNSLGMPVKRGDDVTVKVTPCGAPEYQFGKYQLGNGCGQTVVLQRRIEDMPPMFSRHVSTTFDGDKNLYTAQLSATDPDGDPVTYALEGAPAGMKIDPSSGLIEWKVPQGVKGTRVTAVASDGHGGTTEMTLNINPE